MKTFTIMGMCSTKKQPIGIQYLDGGESFVAVSAFKVYGGGGSSSEERTGHYLTGSKFKCICGNESLANCPACGVKFCYDGMAHDGFECPSCGYKMNVGASKVFDPEAEEKVIRTIKVDKQ